MPQTTSTQIGSPHSEYYDKLYIKTNRPNLVHGMFGMKRTVPKGESNTYKVRKYGSFPQVINKGIEGVNPDPMQWSKEDKTATVDLYSAYTELTEEVDLYNPDPVLTIATEEIGQCKSESIDIVDRDILNAGTSVFRGGAVGARTSIVTKVTTAELDKIVRAMKNNKAKFFKNMIKAATGIGTTPIRPTYLCITHPDVIYDLEQLTGWVPVSQYASQGDVNEFEVGAYKNLRFIESTQAKIWANGGGAIGSTGCKSTGGSLLDIYSILIFSPEAYTVIDFEGFENKIIIKDKSQVGGPTEAFGTVAFKARHGAIINDDTKMYRYEVAVSA